jgi:hypothetical protein
LRNEENEVSSIFSGAAAENLRKIWNCNWVGRNLQDDKSRLHPLPSSDSRQQRGWSAPVAFLFVNKETTDTISKCLQIFTEVNKFTKLLLYIVN